MSNTNVSGMSGSGWIYMYMRMSVAPIILYFQTVEGSAAKRIEGEKELMDNRKRIVFPVPVHEVHFNKPDGKIFRDIFNHWSLQCGLIMQPPFIALVGFSGEARWVAEF